MVDLFVGWRAEPTISGTGHLGVLWDRAIQTHGWGRVLRHPQNYVTRLPEYKRLRLYCQTYESEEKPHDQYK